MKVQHFINFSTKQITPYHSGQRKHFLFHTNNSKQQICAISHDLANLQSQHKVGTDKTRNKYSFDKKKRETRLDKSASHKKGPLEYQEREKKPRFRRNDSHIYTHAIRTFVTRRAVGEDIL